MIGLSLVVGALAVARLTRLLVEDRIMLWYRRAVITKAGDQSLAAYFVMCPWCTSIWVAAAVMPIATLFPNRWVIAALAIPAASWVAGAAAQRLEE